MNSLSVFFPIQQRSFHNNIKADKHLNLFDEYAAECVHLCPQKEECIFSFWGDSKLYTSGPVETSHKTPTKLNKNGAVAKVRILVKQVIL